MSQHEALDEDIARFERDGAICLRGIFADWVKPLAEGVEFNLSNPSPMATEQTPDKSVGRFFDDMCNWQRIPQYKDFVLNSPAAEISAKFMRSSTSQFFHDHLIVKEPGTTKSTPWHQDMPYYDLQGKKTLSFWLPLDPVAKEVCVKYVAGSHLRKKLCMPRYFIDARDFDDGGEGFEPVPDIDENPEQYNLLSWEMEAGDAILFDHRALHGTGKVLMEGRRRGFATRWLGDDIRYRKRPGQTSPSFEDLGLSDGDLLREDMFPILWPQEKRSKGF